MAGRLGFANARMTGRCDLCRREGPLFVDHDYKTDLVRGFLCHACNVGLGMLGETVEGLQRAIAYLQQPPSGLTYTEVKRERTKLQQRELRARRKDAPEWAEWREKEAERNRLRSRAWQAEHREQQRERSKRYYYEVVKPRKEASGS